MTIQERMVARSEREKDLLKYGRSQARERIIKLLEDTQRCTIDEDCHCRDCCNCSIIALIKGEK